VYARKRKCGFFAVEYASLKRLLLEILVFLFSVMLFIQIFFYNPLYALFLLAITYLLISLFFKKKKLLVFPLNIPCGRKVEDERIKENIMKLRIREGGTREGIKLVGRQSESREMIDLAIKAIALKKKAKMGKRRIKGSSLVVDYRIPRSRFFPLALPATIRRSVIAGSFPRITPQDLREKIFGGKGKLSLIIVLDTSASMSFSIGEILSSFEAIKKEAVRYRDRVSLIICKGFKAYILQHPTTNFNLILGKLREISLSDFTPLAEGLHKGLSLALLEDRRGYTPIIILISDGFANVPLIKKQVGDYVLLGGDPAVKSLLQVAKDISRKKIETIVINTRHMESDPRLVTPRNMGTRIMMKIAMITRGTYIGLENEERARAY